MSELERIVAWAFRARRHSTLPAKEFCHLLSLGQRWFSPAEAQRILERALEAGLLELREEGLRPAFDVEDVELPLGFRGSRAALAEPLPAHRAQGAGSAASATAQPPATGFPGPHAALLAQAPAQRVQAMREQSGGALGEDAARLLALREQGLDVSEAAAAALAALAPVPVVQRPPVG